MLAGRLHLDQTATSSAVVALMGICSLALATSRSAWIVIGAQVVLALLLATTGIFLARLLNDAIPSTIRWVASGVSTLSWIVFLPCALAFGMVSKEYGEHSAGWIMAALTVVSGLLLVKVGCRSHTGARNLVGHECVGDPADHEPRLDEEQDERALLVR